MLDLVILAVVVMIVAVIAGRALLFTAFSLYSIGYLLGVLLLVIGGLKLGLWIGERRRRK